MAKKRAAILISGRGSNMEALINAARDPDYPAEIVGVIANKPDAAGLEFARGAGLVTAVVRLKDFPDKAAADAEIDAHLSAWGIDLVCLAGFMRLLGPEFCENWQGRILNIHPALLPKFPGLNTHERAIAAGETEHGCTVHFVTAGMDEGPAIGQASVPILPSDTPETLGARVLAEEHRLYPACLAAVARGRTRLT